MLYVVRESSFEEIVGSLFKGDSLEGVEETLIALLQFFREGFVCEIGPLHHFDHDSQRRGSHASGKDGGYLPVGAPLNSVVHGGPARVELPH